MCDVSSIGKDQKCKIKRKIFEGWKWGDWWWGIIESDGEGS
jgi:hypothetical protein